MVLTRDGKLRTKARKAGSSHIGLSDLQSLHRVAHHRCCDVRCAVCILRITSSLSRQKRCIQTTVIQNRPNLIARTSGLPGIDDILADVVKHREITAHFMERKSLIAVSRSASRNHIVLRSRPPNTHEVFHRVTNVCGFLNGNLVHHTPTPEQDIVRTFTTDLEPLGFLFLTRIVDRDRGKVKTVLFRQGFQRRDRLFAVSSIKVQQCDFLTFN